MKTSCQKYNIQFHFRNTNRNFAQGDDLGLASFDYSQIVIKTNEYFHGIGFVAIGCSGEILTWLHPFDLSSLRKLNFKPWLEREVANQMTVESNISILTGGVLSSLYGRKKLRPQLQKYGYLGYANLILAGGLCGFVIWHRIRHSTLTNQFPEGYYRIGYYA